MTDIFLSSAHKDAVYGLMLERIECGPFDGGCLAFALALQRLHGGEIAVVEGRFFVPPHISRAQHAVLALPDGTFMDASGRCAERTMLARTAAEARHVATADRIRPLQEGDLPEAARDDNLVADLARMLMEPPSPSPDSGRASRLRR
jgi:hypothetical protein